MATINAASCSRDHVVAAYNSASAGDTVSVPAGSATWSSAISVAKEVAIIGQSTVSNAGVATDSTVITCAQAFDCAADNIRISGFTFTGAGSSSGVIRFDINGSSDGCTDWRVDHCHFSSITERGIQVGRDPTEANRGPDIPGLIDHNRFDGATSFKTVQFYGHTNSTHGFWDTDLDLGGSNFLFVEDNYFVFNDVEGDTSTIDGDKNGRIVIRKNYFKDSWISFHGVEENVASALRSTHAWEIYSNTFVNTASHNFWLNIRGGTGVIYSNDFTSTVASPTPIRYFYERGDYDSATRGCYNATEPCNGSQYYDGNEVGKYGYPCFQQIGMSGADGITSTPVYQWSNAGHVGETDYVDADITTIAFSGT